MVAGRPAWRPAVGWPSPARKANGKWAFFATTRAIFGDYVSIYNRKTSGQITADIRQLVSKATPTEGRVNDVFTAAGLIGQTVVIEGSTNLVAWEPIATNRFRSTTLRFMDSSATNASCRFYRLRLQ
jgi:hypothetical protein